MNATTYPHWRAARLLTLRAEMKQIFRTGGMSDSDLFDMLCMLGEQCAPEQSEWRDRISTLTSDLEPCEPDADAFQGLGPATLEQRLERA